MGTGLVVVVSRPQGVTERPIKGTKEITGEIRGVTSVLLTNFEGGILEI